MPKKTCTQITLLSYQLFQFFYLHIFARVRVGSCIHTHTVWSKKKDEYVETDRFNIRCIISWTNDFYWSRLRQKSSVCIGFFTFSIVLLLLLLLIRQHHPNINQQVSFFFLIFFKRCCSYLNNLSLLIFYHSLKPTLRVPEHITTRH